MKFCVDYTHVFFFKNKNKYFEFENCFARKKKVLRKLKTNDCCVSKLKFLLADFYDILIFTLTSEVRANSNSN